MNTTTLNPEILKSKQHFEILDGLRGIAAVAVVIFHFMEWAYSDFTQNFIAHGFLAVDFFFCLSGFVIAYAYDDRIGKMGVVEFLKSRLIRLHPLIVLGSVLGLLTFLFDPFNVVPESYSAGKIALLFLSSVLLIPYPVMEERAFNLFGLNAPAWTLFWEYVANIFYVLILWRIKKNLHLSLLLLAAGTLCLVSYRAGNLVGGWDKTSFWDGGARIFYSFLAGMAVYRFNWIIKNNLGFIGMSVLLSLAFLMPFGKWNWLTEPLVVLCYFPALVALGAGATSSNGLRKLYVFSGKISYPLYMTHYAVLWIFGSYYTTHKPAAGELTLIILGSVSLLIAFAYLAMVVYDIPVRKYLTAKRKSQLFNTTLILLIASFLSCKKTNQAEKSINFPITMYADKAEVVSDTKVYVKGGLLNDPQKTTELMWVYARHFSLEKNPLENADKPYLNFISKDTVTLFNKHSPYLIEKRDGNMLLMTSIVQSLSSAPMLPNQLYHHVAKYQNKKTEGNTEISRDLKPAYGSGYSELKIPMFAYVVSSRITEPMNALDRRGGLIVNEFNEDVIKQIGERDTIIVKTYMLTVKAK